MASSTTEGATLLTYVKHAFLVPWNLVVFLGAAVGAAASPYPDAFLPILGAVELGYLGVMSSLPAFRLAIDAKLHKDARGGDQAARADASAGLMDILVSLTAEDRLRFERLRRRCRDMRTLASEVQGATDTSTVGDLRTSGLDQLLWGFLRLLRHHNALERLLQTMNELEITTTIDEVQTGLSQAKLANDDRLQRSYEDRLATAQQRLEYFQRTTKDAKFVGAELDRIEEKIRALSEMAVNQHDPDALSAQIDAAASSMQHTEATISQLQAVTGLSDSFATPPIIMDADPRVAPLRTR